jgi:hypothetical protein
MSVKIENIVGVESTITGKLFKIGWLYALTDNTSINITNDLVKFFILIVIYGKDIWIIIWVTKGW